MDTFKKKIQELNQLIDIKKEERDRLEKRFQFHKKEKDEWDEKNREIIELAKKNEDLDKYYRLIDTQNVFLNKMLEVDEKATTLSGEILDLLEEVKKIEKEMNTLSKDNKSK